MKKKAIIIGAGIVGLATARALALQNFHVEVFEKHPRAQGASIRNFGMIWPIGSYWNGTIPKMQGGSTEKIITPQVGVTIINGFGEAGMTHSFGLAEELISTD